MKDNDNKVSYDYRLFNEETYTEGPDVGHHHSINGGGHSSSSRSSSGKRVKLIASFTAVAVVLILTVVLTVVFVLRAQNNAPGDAINGVVANIVVTNDEGETLVQLNATTLGPELWHPLAQSFDMSQLIIKNINITECVCTDNSTIIRSTSVQTSPVRISTETNKVIITGLVSEFLGMIESRVTLVIMMPTSLHSALEGTPKIPELVLQVHASLDWNPKDLSFFKPHANSSEPWITGISFRASGSVVVSSTSFSQFTLQDGDTYRTETLVRGLNLLFHDTSLNIQSSNSTVLATALEALPLDVSVEDLNIDFMATIETTDTNTKLLKASLYLSANIQLGVVISPIKSDLRLWVTQEGIDINPTFGLDTTVEMDLRPLNPDITVKVSGSLVQSADSFSLRLDGLVTTSNWDKPFGLDWLRFGDVVVAITADKNGLGDCSFQTSASVTFPSSNVQKVEFYGLLTSNGDLLFTTSLADGEQMTLASLPRLVADLLDLDYDSVVPSISESFTIAENIKISIAISTKEGAFSLRRAGFGVDRELQVGKGLTIMTTVDAGAIVENITSVFFTESHPLEFRAGIVIPIFDIVDVNSFKQNFEAFLSTPDIVINDKFTFLGIDVIVRPFVPSFVISGSGNITLDATDSLLCYVSGEFSAISAVTLGGSVLGSWRSIFGVKGLNVGNVSLEIGFIPGASITGFGMSASIDIGTVEADLQLAIQATDMTSFYLYANVDNLSLRDIILFLDGLNIDSNGGSLIGDTTGADLLNFENLEIYIAPSDGELQGIRYEKGFGIAGEVQVFFFKVAGSVKLVEGRTVGLLQFDDARIYFKLTFLPIEEIVENFIEFLFPGVDIPSLAIDLGPIGTLSLSDIFSITSIELEEFSVYDIFHGELPVFTLVVKIAGVERAFSSDMPFDALVQSLPSFLEASDLPEYVSKCISNAQCTTSPNDKCDHTQQPWVCVDACPSSSEDIPDMGCFTPEEFDSNGTGSNSTTTLQQKRTHQTLSHVRRREVGNEKVRHHFREVIRTA